MATNPSHSAFTQLASEKQIEKTVQALQAHGIRMVVCETGEEARNYVLDLIPSGAEVYNSPSRTLLRSPRCEAALLIADTRAWSKEQGFSGRKDSSFPRGRILSFNGKSIQEHFPSYYHMLKRKESLVMKLYEAWRTYAD